MAKVDLTKATASNWQSLVNKAIKDAKSKCGNVNIWNGEKEFNAIKNYMLEARALVFFNTEANPSKDIKAQIEVAKKMYDMLYDATIEASIEINGHDMI